MITIKTPEEIKIMSEGGMILARTLRELQLIVRPGITTNELDKLSEELLLKSGAKCAFKGYKEEGSKTAFPACLCVSVNDEVVHYPPSGRILEEGDIVSLDLGVLFKGFYTDMAVTVPVGKVSPAANELIETTREALEKGIKEAKPGNHFGDIGHAIQRHVESNGFVVVRDLCGHGIGKKLHEDPQILNYSPLGMKKGERGTGPEITEGMVFCIEPITSAGPWQIKKEGIGYKTIDNSLSAHFEHAIAVTKKGNIVLTSLRNEF
ncbi:MAG: Methionine aminopeptidase [Parcubacteria group bacterium GW2011_GWC1_38_6]|nr:MAG: Methionine aminopeptidase [Parcubacteria group bacterium GW2011_GWA1_36_12]KKQ77310.1 MAG: Methionine aminopeptidase [Parcubacteria group bacterium GW2011_GWC1_38_6]